VSRLTEEVRQRVQRMVVEALGRRGPAFFQQDATLPRRADCTWR